MLKHRSRVRFGAALTVVGSTMLTGVLLSTGDRVAAVELTDVTLDVTVTPTALNPGDRIRTDVEFCVPDSAVENDTFSVTLPNQLTQLPSSITLRDPSSEIVAVADIAGSPAVATFTLTDYVDTRVDVCGTAFFESQLRSDTTPESQQTLSFVISGGATFDIVVDVGTAVTGVDRTEPRKSAIFTDPGDQCRTAVASCVQWFIESMPGPFDSVSIVDDGLIDASFECGSLSVLFWTLLPDGSRDTSSTPPGGSVTSTCTPDSLDVDVANVPADQIVRVLISATPDVPDPDGDRTYVNGVSVTQVSASTGTTTVEVTGSVRSSAAGGEASGVVPTTTTTTTTPTTTIATTTPTTTIGGTTTTLPGSGVVAPTTTVRPTTTIRRPVTLPPTGGGDATVLVASMLVVGGVALLAASRRRTATD